MMPQQYSRPASPKLVQSDQDPWYRYYAGYSSSFVRDVVEGLKLGSSDVVLDPWNGAGTTTQVADKIGIAAWGTDINPAAVTVAKARLLGNHVTPSELPLCDGILRHASQNVHDVDEGDPLLVWFGTAAATAIRSLERAIRDMLHPAKPVEPSEGADRVSSMSALTSFYYVALFRATRELLAGFRVSNPTWVRRPKLAVERVRPSANRIHTLFRSNVQALTALLAVGPARPSNDLILGRAGQAVAATGATTQPGAAATITVASSTKLPFDNNSATAVVSSPPYCTRIDYAVSTGPELAVLGFSDEYLRQLRDAMIGTSTISESSPSVDFAWGPTCANFLDAVASHPSKASQSYYLKTHLQYFDGLARSLSEIDRVLKPRASCALVVQDSHYKEIHNDLPSIVTEIADSLGWSLEERYDYEAARNLARINPKSRRYRRVTTATETVLMFEKP